MVPIVPSVMPSSRRSLFRPCIDLHDGHVKQIVGGTLSESDPGSLKTNFVAKYATRIASAHLVSLSLSEEKRLQTLRSVTNCMDYMVDI
jgi:phosphoribosylformimino-5-aminoimidazole carboxamide ribonucleotide (ProFAR) isomerase